MEIRRNIKNILLVIFFISLNLNGQNTIKGKLFTSENFKEHFPLINVSIKGFSEKKLIDNNGLFELQIEKEQSDYIINFYINDSIVKTYNYKHVWTKRKKPKSISFVEECTIISKSVRNDYKKNTVKLYVFQKKPLSKKDIKIQKRYNFTYTLVYKKDLKSYDCYKKYNHRAFKYLVLGNKLSLDKINNNTIGKSKFSLLD
ncbi:hypothetical protein [uncultured Tenacibaculum sp.]|uniref:hypothetical protein n=1 Tax=uncultured Tenacibaculum sp. TaxID=174713 RepID=UPI0026203E3A|nr:hypothetical protein [uncultured Tenacibaculum sp.]